MWFESRLLLFVDVGLIIFSQKGPYSIVLPTLESCGAGIGVSCQKLKAQNSRACAESAQA